MESNLVCNHVSDEQNQMNAKWESDLLITSMIADRIGQQEVLLPINGNHFNKKKIHLEQISLVETMSLVKNSSNL